MSVQWAARAVPTHRRALVADLDATAERLERLAGQGRSQGVGEQQLRDAAAVRGQRWWARQAEVADLFWVSGDMARLALDASQDVPDFDPLQLPVPNGLMLFGDPLPDMLLPAATYLRGGLQWQGRVPVWVIWWFPVQVAGRPASRSSPGAGIFPSRCLPGPASCSPCSGRVRRGGHR